VDDDRTTGSGPGCRVAGIGVALPERAVANDELVERLATSDEWIVERSGIRWRHVAAGPFVPPPKRGGDHLGTTGTLAVEAGRRALDAAGIVGSQVDLLLVCTTTPDHLVPATSAAVAADLGITAGAMDLNAACAGFTYGLVTAVGHLGLGARRVLLVGAESLSQVTNWHDRTNAFLFGDGAGAVVVEAADGPPALLGWDVGVDGTLVDLLYAEHGSYGDDASGMVMRGPEVFRQAVRVTVDSARLALRRAGVDARDVALLVPHQANRRIMDAVAHRLDIPSDRVASVIDRTANTSSASIPLALADAVGAGRLHDGDLVLFAGFGAGMTWASAVWRWDGRPSTPNVTSR
jgi:3-oxoacyl-[acyl-carrier-protein] synthase-3